MNNIWLNAVRASGAAAFTPADDPDLQLWLEADSGLWLDAAMTTAADADNDLIRAWSDQGSGGRDHTQTADIYRPRLRLNYINGHPVLEFNIGNNASHLLRSEDYLNSPSGCILAVVRPGLGNRDAVFSATDTSTTTARMIARARNNTTLMGALQQNGDTADIPEGDTAIDIASNHLMVWSSDGSAYGLRLNLADEVITMLVGSNNGDWFGDVSGKDTSVVGGVLTSAGLGTEKLVGFLAALVVSDSTSQLAMHEEYLRAKYFGSNPVGKVLHTIDILDQCDGAQISDIDGDGKIDIATCIASGASAGIFWYEQGATPDAWTQHAIYSGGTQINGIDAADYDGDGEIEVISLDMFDTGKIRLHKHPVGNPAGVWTTVELKTGRIHLQDAQAIDIDGDGLPEIVYTWQGEDALTGGIRWLDFDGTDVTDPADWTEYTMIDHPGAWWLASSNVRWSVGNVWLDNRPDLAGNGRGDVIFSSRNNARNPGATPGLYWLEEPVDPTGLWTLNTIDSTVADWLHCDFGDFSGDGNGKDVLAFDLHTAQGPRYYRFSDSWSEQTISLPDATTEHYNIRRGPEQHGGRDDIIVVTGDGTAVGGVYVYEFSGSAYVQRQLEPLDYVHPMEDRIILFDIDGDGIDEAIIPDSDGDRLVWLKLYA